jgi:hypothetical protein
MGSSDRCLPQPSIAMQTEASILSQLRFAYELVADILGQAPQLYDCHLDQALLLLVLAMKRAQRSPKLRQPRQRQPAYPVQDMLF